MNLRPVQQVGGCFFDILEHASRSYIIVVSSHSTEGLSHVSTGLKLLAQKQCNALLALVVEGPHEVPLRHQDPVVRLQVPQYIQSGLVAKDGFLASLLLYGGDCSGIFLVNVKHQRMLVLIFVDEAIQRVGGFYPVKLLKRALDLRLLELESEQF